jgi:hypothetical protein
MPEAPALQPGIGFSAAQQFAGNLAVQRLFQAGAIQSKLNISQPNDPDEQEADRVTDQVMRMAEPGPISSAPGVIHRKCAACEAGEMTCPKCEKEEKVRRKEEPGQAPQVGPTAHAQISALRGGGQPLPPSARAFFEPRFDADFSQVRLHTNSAAAEAARAIQAKAFTTGQDVAFATGEYVPDSAVGRKLLAHELTHTLQQKNRAALQAGGLISHGDDPAEGEAQWMADHFAPTRETDECERRDSAGPPAIQQHATSAIQRDNDTPADTSVKAGFGNQPRDLGKAGFGNKPHAVKPQPGDQPQPADDETLAEALFKAGVVPVTRAYSLDFSWEPAENIERFKRIWMAGGQTAFEAYAHELLQRMSNTGGPDAMDKFADRFWDYIWNEIGGVITSDPTVQMMVGIGASILFAQKRIKEEVEERKKFIASFEEEARKYTREALKKSQERVIGELKHYFGASWIRDYLFDSTDDSRTLEDDRAARRGLGIAAAGLARRRNALIKANTDYRNMVRTWGHYTPYSEMKPVEDAQEQADRAYEVFRLQVIAVFPILEEISSPEIHPFNNEYDEPDDPQGEQLNKLAKMAKDGNMGDGFEFIVTTVRDKLRNIEKVRDEIEPGGDINIWRVPELVQGTRERIGVARDSVEAELIDQKFAEENRPRNESEGILGEILLYGGLILAPFTEFLSLVPYGIYEAGKVGIAISEHIKEYMTQKALHGTDFGAAAISAEDPSLFWLAGDILNAGLAVINLAPLAGPAVRMFRRLAPFARLAREVKAGEEALITLRNSAKEAAGQELKLGVDEATEFAENVAAHARAARSGEALGMTADEARMLAQAEPAAAKAAAKQLDVLAAQPAPMTVGEQTARVEELLAKQKELKAGIEQANSTQRVAGNTIDNFEDATSLTQKQSDALKKARASYDKARETEDALKAKLQTVEADLIDVRRQVVQPTSWQELQSSVYQRQLADHAGMPVGEQITLDVTDVATKRTVEIQIDVAVLENAELKLVDAKFSAKKDLTQGKLGGVYTANQSVVYPWISGGNKVIVVPKGANAAKMGLKVGEPVKVSPKIEVHVNSPEGIRVRDFKDTI